MSTFETIYVIGHTIGSFLLLMIPFFVVKDYIMPFVKRVYQYIIKISFTTFYFSMFRRRDFFISIKFFRKKSSRF